MRHRIIETCTGPFVVMQDAAGRITTSWLNAEVRRRLKSSLVDENLLPVLTRKLKRYFAGEDIDFSEVVTPGGPDFYVKCWDVCRRIKRGKTLSYAELAVRAGSTASAARAAGQAMRNNPLPIVVPCHRVVGSSGRLHGFGGSCDAEGQELGVKFTLLQMERAKIAEVCLPRYQELVAT